MYAWLKKYRAELVFALALLFDTALLAGALAWLLWGRAR